MVSQADQRDREKEEMENVTSPQLATGIVPKGKDCSVLVYTTEKRAWKALLADFSLAATVTQGKDTACN